MTKTPLQLGMIGLGRMGANMVRRLIKDGHQCVVFDRLRRAVKHLAKEKATGSSSLADFVKKLAPAARHLADGAGGGRGQDPSPTCCRCWKRATSSLTAAIPITWTTSAARRNLRRKEFIMLMSARAAASGAWNAAIA